MFIQEALKLVAQDFFISRRSWPQHTFVYWMPGLHIDKDSMSPRLKNIFYNRDSVTVQPYYSKSVDGTITTGWTPTADDLNASDWYLYGSYTIEK